MKSFLHRHQRLLAVLLFLGVLLAIFVMSGIREHLNLAFMQQRILENRLSGLLLFLLLFALGNLIQIPGWLFLAAAVLTLGQTLGGIATYVAATISCVITFLIIRGLGGNALRQLDAHPIASVALLRVLFQTVPALNYALAMSGVRLRHYLIGTLLGLPLPIALYCLFFDYLAKVFKLG